jgi:DNA-binding CsgD family transcriptional regulator
VTTVAKRCAFVGRHDDVEHVRRAVDGRARLVVIEGEPGVGKTRLIDEALQRHDAHPPIPILRGTADRDAIRPLGAFVEALAGGVAAWSTVPESVRRHGDAVVSLFGSRPGLRAGRDLSAFEVQDGLLAVLSAQLKQHGALVLDDLHWADAETFTALGRVVLSGIGCTVVVGARSDELPDEFVDVVEQIERRHDVVRIRLGALGRDDVADLLRRTYGAQAAVNADMVHERTSGHPLLLVQLIESGALLEADLTALPSSAEESIRRRLTAVDATARDVLNDAAVLGSAVHFDDLIRVRHRSDLRLTRALRELCDQRLLTESESDVFTFVHALTRQVVESSMLARERRAAHRRVLATLPDDAAPVRVLHHAIGAGDDQRASAAASLGAPLALAAGQPTRARDMAALATSSNPDDAGLWAVLALASWQLRNRAEARRAAERALALSDGDVIMTARLRWLLARVALESLDTDRFLANLSELESLERIARGAERAEVLTSCAELMMLRNSADEVAWGNEAVAAAIGTPLEGRARLSLGSSLTNEPGRRDEGRAILAEIVERQLCDSYHHARALNNLLCDVVYAWPAADVWSLIDKFERHVVATALHAVFAEQVALYREQCAERLGDAALARAALEWFGPVEPEPFTCLASAAALLELDGGRTGPACRAVVAASDALRHRADREKLVWCDAVAVEVAARGQPTTVEPLLERLFDPEVVQHRFMIDAIAARGRAARALMSIDAATASTTLDRWYTWIDGDPDGLAMTAHLEGAHAEMHGNVELATDRYVQALDGAPVRACTALADIQRGLARCAAAGGDREAARSWARQSMQTLDRWPGVGLDESIRLLRQLGGRPALTRTDGVLSDRELQVATLVSRGFTNREIGDELRIAPRTVGVHVSHVLEKLRVSRRSEIAAYVARRSAS